MSSSSTTAPSSSAPAAPAIPAPLSVADNMKKLNNFEVWILDCLIRLYLQPNQRIAEFCCGNGIILSRLMVDMLSNSSAPKSAENAFLVAQYYGLEGDAGSAKNKWITKDTPFNAEFLDVDVVLQPVPSSPNNSSPSPILPASSLDIIFCVKSLARCGASRTALRCFLSNVSRSLKIGGLFIGTLFDPQPVWYKITKRDREGGGAAAKPAKGEKGEGVVAFGPGYKLDFPTLPRSNAQFTPFTTNLKFYFQLLDGTQQKPSKNAPPPFSSFLIHLPSLVEEAKSQGLEVVSLQNCAEFLAEQKEVDELEQTLRKLNLQSAYQNPNLMDLFALNMIYVFKKTEEVNTSATTSANTNGGSSNGINTSTAMEE